MMRILVIVTILASLLYCCEGLHCSCVKEERCKADLSKCSYGIVADACQCCDVCAKGPGERCGGPWNFGGKCGQGLICMNNRQPGSPYGPYGKCQKA